MAFAVLFVTSMTVSAQNVDIDTPIPVDPEVTIGQLDNGLTYYIRPNSKPAEKVQLRLVVNAGSILENDDQQGLAHFMEHMNFNGLKHFPKHELIEYLQSIGVRFGADLNANTGFDRTYYILPIPTDKKGNLKNGFQIVADWAGGALITDEQVNAERKVVVEELRMRDKDANTRMMKQYLPEMLNGSKYAERLPSGKKEIILNADPDLIRDFYNDWYRPNNMAVIVVGDITTEKAVQMIKKYFGDLENPKNAPERTYYTVAPYTQSEAMVVTDKEATGYSFRLLFPAQKVEQEETLSDYRESLVRSIFRLTINHRLRKLTQSAHPPYAGAYASLSGVFGGFTLKNKGFALSLTPIDNFEKSIDSAVAELLRIREYGFSKEDIKNTKQKFMAFYEKSYNERQKTRSNSYVSEYTRNFMSHEPIPGIVNEYEYAQKMLPTITAKEVSDLANEILSNSKNFFALITGPTEGDINLPSEAQLLTIVKTAFTQDVEPREDTATATSLLTQLPTPGDIINEKSDKQLGTTTYTLSNGVKVTVKNTDFKADQIIFKGIKYGGSNQYGAEDKANANFMTSIVNAMGYGEFSPMALNDFLSGKVVSLGVGMGKLTNSVSGSSSVQDFETLLKLNYLKLTSPRKSENLFKGFITKQKTRLQFLQKNPRMAFIDTLVNVMYHNDPLAPITIPTPEDFENTNLERVLEMYNTQFGYADGFHFFIVGNLNKVDIKPLLKKYLASLPVKGVEPHYVDNGLRMVKGDKVFKFYKGHNDKSMILIQYHGTDIDYSEKLALQANLLGQIMTMQITDTIREKMQVIYSGGAYANVSDVPYDSYSVMFQLPTGPEHVDVILAEIKDEVNGYITNGGPEGSLTKAKKATLEGHKEDLKKNGYWASKLEDVLFWNKGKKFFLNYASQVKNVTEKEIIKTAKKLFSGDRFVGISYPEPSEKE